MVPSPRPPLPGGEGGNLHAFEACGLELEYALVDRASLEVAPIADQVLQRGRGTEVPVNDWPRGALGWSNELVTHVIELKNVAPDADLGALARRLQDEVTAMNRALAAFGARLMPGGMHPWMDPARETRLWPHEHAEVYRAYDRIFGCRSHGWANLQSTHVNLPFAGDAEFARVHAALRVIAPLVPALAAASPYADARAPGPLDYRMEVYRTNADAIPEMNGNLVPEIVTSRADYERTILAPLYRAIAPHDAGGLMQHEWLNARAVIARFDRSALELRVMDAQECPRMDVGLAAIVMDLAQSLCERELARPEPGNQLPSKLLADILLRCVHDADRARIESPDFLGVFGMARRECSAGDLWSFLADRLERERAPRAAVWGAPVEFALARGPLARRLLRAIGPRPDRPALHELYTALCDALEAGKPFDP